MFMRIMLPVLPLRSAAIDTKLYFLCSTYIFTGTGRLKQKHADYLKTLISSKDSQPCKSAISLASGATADELLKDGDRVVFGSRYLSVVPTPGHTQVSIVATVGYTEYY